MEIWQQSPNFKKLHINETQNLSSWICSVFNYKYARDIIEINVKLWKEKKSLNVSHGQTNHATFAP